MAEKTQQIRLIYKVAAFLAFILLGYLGLRSYRLSVEKLKVNACIEEVGELVANIQQVYSSTKSYKDFDYKTAVSLGIIPRRMFKEGISDAVNSYIGGVDMFYSSLFEENDNKAFEISFQGLSSFGCRELMRIDWSDGQGNDFIAVAGYPNPMPSGVLDGILYNQKQEDIVQSNIFKATNVRFVGLDKIANACKCDAYNCTVVWKFK